MIKKIVVALCLILCVSNVCAQIENILGYWATVDDRTGESYSVVQIYKEANGKYYGKIVEMLVAGTEKMICIKCEGEYHNMPIVGMVFIQDMEYKNNQLCCGRLLDPESGKFYYGKISYSAKTGELELRGSLDKFGLLGRSQHWKRIRR